jgi:UrcA family protein
LDWEFDSARRCRRRTRQILNLLDTWSHAMTTSTHPITANRLARVTLAMCASTVFAVGTMSASAGTPPADVPRVIVDYSDLNLATEHGAHRLYQRISTAARQVCPPDTSVGARVASIARQCVSDAIARAVNEVNNPRVAELGAARMRRSGHG